MVLILSEVSAVALMENLSLEKASPEELLEIAQKRGIDIYKYQLLI